MSVEQAIDAYLHMAQQILGDPTTSPAAPPPQNPPAGIPHPEWLGDAANAATAASTALAQARQQLTAAADDLSSATTTATQIGRDAALQLQGITNDWGAAKAALASTPQPMRDSALITEGQQHIAQAMTLISATTARYAAAAAAVQDTAAGLPPTPKNPAPTPNRPQYPSPGVGAPDLADTDIVESGADISPMTGLGGDPGAAAAMAFMPPMAAPSHALPAAMSAMPNGTPATTAPMSSMLPSAAAPLSNLAGLTNQLGSNPLTATPAPNSNSTPRRSRPGSVDEAIDEALDALGVTDPAARARWHAGYNTLIARESGGSAHAVNRSDSNARGTIQSDGAPAGSSRGLTQMTPATFHRYRVPGLSTDIYEPVSNIAASMRYVMDRYHVDASATNLAANVQQANPRARARGY